MFEGIKKYICCFSTIVLLALTPATATAQPESNIDTPSPIGCSCYNSVTPPWAIPDHCKRPNTLSFDTIVQRPFCEHNQVRIDTADELSNSGQLATKRSTDSLKRFMSAVENRLYQLTENSPAAGVAATLSATAHAAGTNGKRTLAEP